MLEVVVGALAALLVLTGVAIIAAPVVPRGWRVAREALDRSRRGAVALTEAAAGLPPDSNVHPTTARALTAAARTYSLLRASGQDRVALELRAAARLVRADEARGLLALGTVLRELREASLPDQEADARLRGLVIELRDAVRDRCEQLELLPFG